MKHLFTLLLIAFASFAQAQLPCDPTVTPISCATCTTPQFYSATQGVIISGSTLWVNWINVNWQFPGSTECSKGISFIIDGVEYFANSAGYVHPSAVSGAQVAGYTVVPGATICVVLRNYCTEPYPCNPTNYAESVPMCVTDNSVPSTTTIDCKCGTRKKKYHMTKPGMSTACVSKYQCQTMLGYGWTNDCNCQ